MGLLALLAAAVAGSSGTAQAGEWKVNAGVLRVGAVVRADRVRVGAGGVLAGQGRVEADVLVNGLVSPDGGAGGSIGTLSVVGKVEFLPPGRFVCDVAFTPSVADLLLVSGPVYGICGVAVNQGAGAVPWRTAIVAGVAGSDYAGFSIDPWGSTNCRLETSGFQLLLTDIVSDSDGDGMPDYWERERFGDPTGADPNEDADRDGHSNRQEFLAGTDPWNPGSCLRWLGIATEGEGSLALTWSSAEGKSYRVTRSSGDLGVFTPLTNGVPASPPQNSMIIRLDSERQVFYRIELE